MDQLVGIVAFATLGITSVLCGLTYALLCRTAVVEKTIADLKRELEEMKRKE